MRQKPEAKGTARAKEAEIAAKQQIISKIGCENENEKTKKII